MKKLVLIVFMQVLPVFVFAQSYLNKFEGKQDVTSVEITKKMFEMMSQFDQDVSGAEASQYIALMHKLDNLKMYSTSSDKVASQMRKAFGKYVKKAKMDELVKLDDSGERMRIAVKSIKNSRNITEMLLFAEGDSELNPTLLMLLKGNFTLDDISSMTEGLPLPEVEELKGGIIQKL